MKSERIKRAVTESAWAILPVALEKLVADMESAEEGELKAAQGSSERGFIGSIAVIPIRGAIYHRVSWLTDFFGLATAEGLRAQILQAGSNPDISSIVLDINSPGGTVAGIPELADAVRAVRETKRVVAVANAMAASAAYWVASAASELVVVPSGEVGSIGVFTWHEDMSKAEEQAGVRTTLISAGKYKTEGHPFGPLSDEARAHMQAQVDAFYSMFTEAVAAGRRKPVEQVRAGFGEGRMVMAQEAVRQGMADRVGTLDDVLAGEIIRARRAAGHGPRAEIRTVRDFEAFLRDVGGFSNAEAKRIASAGYGKDAGQADLRDGGLEQQADEMARELRRFAESLKTKTEETDA